MESSSSGFDPQTTSTGSGVNCDALPDEDKDMDGFTINQGDCNDCDANVNPNAIEVIGGVRSAGPKPEGSISTVFSNSASSIAT